MLQKAIPSFVNDIKQLVKKDSQKLVFVRTMLENWLNQLDKDMTIDGKEEDPMMQAFLYLYLSQIYLLENKKQDALDTVLKGIKHTPTLIELQ